MTNPMTRIVNLETNEIIDREMTDEEYQALLAEQELIAASETKRIKEEADKEKARQSAIKKLQDLGLSEKEVKAFLG